MKFLLLLVLIAFISEEIHGNIERVESVVASIADGKLRGEIKKSRNSRDYFSFQGVKYANAGRFQPAEATQPWKGVISAVDFGAECPQIGAFTGEISPNNEDCLYLNVYTPDVGQNKKNLPVMVWIHGGGLFYGSGSEYGADYFMDEDVILVTINYRLASLGFLNTGDGLVSGNNGLRDMIVALEWVQRNIGGFNGDPNRVTIFGESAGGWAVHYLMISPAAKGLFHRVIAQSGTALSPLSFVSDPSKTAKSFAEQLGCPTCCTKKMVDCLKAKDVTELLTAEKSILFSNPGYINVPFGLTIDSGTSEESKKILPATPYELVKQGANKVPLIVGLTENEVCQVGYGVLKNQTLLTELNTNWVNKYAEVLQYQQFVSPDKLEEIADELRKIYLNNEELTSDNINKYTEMVEQVLMTRVVRLTAELQAESNPGVFPYVFTNRGKYSAIGKMFGITDDIAPCHADELQYLFTYLKTAPQLWPELEAEADIEFSRKFVKLWVAFAESGKPSSILGLDWNPASSKVPLGTQLPWYAINANPKYFKHSEDYEEKYVKMDALISNYQVPQISWRASAKATHEEL